MKKPTPKSTAKPKVMKNGAVSDAAKLLKPKPKAKRMPGQMTPELKKWLNSLPPRERAVAMVQFKNEKNAGKLSKGTK